MRALLRVHLYLTHWRPRYTVWAAIGMLNSSREFEWPKGESILNDLWETSLNKQNMVSLISWNRETLRLLFNIPMQMFLKSSIVPGSRDDSSSNQRRHRSAAFVTPTRLPQTAFSMRKVPLVRARSHHQQIRSILLLVRFFLKGDFVCVCVNEPSAVFIGVPLKARPSNYYSIRRIPKYTAAC